MNASLSADKDYNLWVLLHQARDAVFKARVLFEEIKLDSGGKVVAAKPRPELEPFFRLSYKCHAKNIAGDPEGI